jgi:hypothetical protein
VLHSERAKQIIVLEGYRSSFADSTLDGTMRSAKKHNFLP